ncbi:VOC family protein [Thalassotalea sp. PS06]|uniref:VOC family protein n=1 Tax=Thalassotalea sp. PS06 TaxID=2594005 RepID=UPI00116548B4|nr:VOC family protein [Thalassotalea sp. PS06]QDP00397.1 VOC family protein [Thalassotalea sp. PS06]
MLHLEHINLVVKDLPSTLVFYQAAFPHWSVRGGDSDTWYGTQRNWIRFGDDYQYLTFNDHGQGNNRDLTSSQLGLVHFAFVTSDLCALISRLGADDPFRRHVYFIDPSGYEVEFVEYLSDLPSERNRY